MKVFIILGVFCALAAGSYTIFSLQFSFAHSPIDIELLPIVNI